MSILEEMVSSENCYNYDNSPVVRSALQRNDFLYAVRLYSERPAYISEYAGLLHIHVLLGLIESRSAVIDAVIKNDDTIHSLTLICASGFAPGMFSRKLKRIAPRAIIEQIYEKNAGRYLSREGKILEPRDSMVFVRGIRDLHRSRNILLGLLLEYRALYTICRTDLRPSVEAASVRSSSDYFLPFVFFESEGRLCGIPEYQVVQIIRSAEGSLTIETDSSCGQHGKINCDDILYTKKINVLNCFPGEQLSRGYYRTMAVTEKKEFILCIPSFIVK
ncbi:hypothetical protein K7I13_00150 [Brucepastera parasyntrophica]|uniref:hypothetical protein n=1 Tax=Brucepastera parasyntrophica TaxID=2880008 RepID=UPI00210B2E8C|nr:hypothetical protein [Brucepastera parasyntrophica]ULQ59814.1 hypothetical protein K7I13_00150 [Brucepastera parasyntrophica]